MQGLTKFLIIGLLLVIASLLMVSSQNIDYSFPNDGWVDRVLGLNQSGYNLTADGFYLSNGASCCGGSGGGTDYDQSLNTTDSVSFAGLNMTANNITRVDCIFFESGGSICSG